MTRPPAPREEIVEQIDCPTIKVFAAANFQDPKAQRSGRAD